MKATPKPEVRETELCAELKFSLDQKATLARAKVKGELVQKSAGASSRIGTATRRGTLDAPKEAATPKNALGVDCGRLLGPPAHFRHAANAGTAR